MAKRSGFRVFVSKDYLKFNAAHFIAYPGFREALHGHNYRVSVEVAGELGPQGYVLDFGIVKAVARRVCKRLDEKTLLPAESDCLKIETRGRQVTVRFEDDEFSFPAQDVLLLPIVHTSAEELARYLAGEIRRELASDGVTDDFSIEVGVAETPGQVAFFRDRA
jgi:6-pyruvoyltetrahydropterin/6-carboxytetrahydropterin synthase